MPSCALQGKVKRAGAHRAAACPADGRMIGALDMNGTAILGQLRRRRRVARAGARFAPPPR